MRLLIELKGEYDNISTTDERYGKTKSRGIVRGIATDITADTLKAIGAEDLKLGSIVYFNKFEDNAPVTVNGKPGCLLKLEEVGGVDNG